MLASQIAEKIAKGEQLDPLETEQFKRLMTDIENSRAFTTGLQGGLADIHVNTIFAKRGEFSYSPVNGANYRRHFTDQSIPHDTSTAVSFDTYGERGSYFRLDTSAPTNIHLKADLPWRYVAVMGAVEFATNGTGRRVVAVNAFDANGVLQYGAGLATATPNGTDNDILPFAYPLIIAPGMVEYLQVLVRQTSGGALDLTYAAVELWVVE